VVRRLGRVDRGKIRDAKTIHAPSLARQRILRATRLLRSKLEGDKSPVFLRELPLERSMMPFVSWRSSWVAQSQAHRCGRYSATQVSLRESRLALSRRVVVVGTTAGCSSEFGATRCRTKSGFGSDGDARSEESRIAISATISSQAHTRVRCTRLSNSRASHCVPYLREGERERERGFLRRVISTETADQSAKET